MKKTLMILAVVAMAASAQAANLVTNASFTNRSMTGWTLIDVNTGRTGSTGASYSANGVKLATPDGIQDSEPYTDPNRTYTTFYAEFYENKVNPISGGSYDFGSDLEAGQYEISLDFVRMRSPQFPVSMPLAFEVYFADSNDITTAVGNTSISIDLNDDEYTFPLITPDSSKPGWAEVTAAQWSEESIIVTLDGTEGADTLVVQMKGTGTAGSGTTRMTFDNVQVNAVPEPATMGLLAVGGIALLRRKRR